MKKKLLITLSAIVGTVLQWALIVALLVSAYYLFWFIGWALGSGYRPLVEGEYVQDYTYSDGRHIYGHLKVTAIDEDAYLEACGINVVRDESPRAKNLWYSIECEYSIDGGETVQIVFVNLQRDNRIDPHASQYIDDNGNTITAGYHIQYNDVSLSFYSSTKV